MNKKSSGRKITLAGSLNLKVDHFYFNAQTVFSQQVLFFLGV